MKASHSRFRSSARISGLTVPAGPFVLMIMSFVVTVPVHPLGTKETSVPVSETGTAPSERKFNPGHYVAVGPEFNLADIKYLDEPAVVGVNKRYRWRDLEPEKGVYDFSSVENDLEYLAGRNKRLVLFLIDRSFARRGALPGYLAAYDLPAEEGGFTPVRWHPEVKERFLKLGEEIGRRFDQHPAFEGTALQESSLGMSKENKKKFNYSVGAYRNALIDILTGFQASMPRSRVFWYGNFIDGDDGKGSSVRKVAERVEGLGVFWGGPDILPYHKGYNRISYPMFREYGDRFTFFSSAQDDSYRHHANDFSHEIEEPVPETGYLTMEEIFLFARDTLRVRYIFWNYFYEAEDGQRTYDDAIEVMRKYPVFNGDE